MESLEGKRCFITGAASGIGRALAQAAAREGAELFLTDLNAALLEETAKALVGAGGRVGAWRAFDVSSFEAVKSFAGELHAQHGSMDVVMNVAGVSVWGSVDRLEHRHWKSTIDVNLMGPIHVIESLLPEMIRAGRGGHLVNVSSAAGLFGLPWHAAYSASKFGLRGISEVLRYDLRRHGIGVSLVCPGGVNTPLVKTVQIVGIDRSRPEVEALKGRFEKHAVTPERAAAAILRGIKKNQYLVFTSWDIRIGYWFQQKFPWSYEWAMRALNNRLHAVVVSGEKRP